MNGNDGKWCSSLTSLTFNIFILQELLGHQIHAMKLPVHQFLLMLVPEEVWNSAVTYSAEHWWTLCTMHFNTQKPCSETFYRVAVVPKGFHFAIIPLTVEHYISSREEIWICLWSCWVSSEVHCQKTNSKHTLDSDWLSQACRKI